MEGVAEQLMSLTMAVESVESEGALAKMSTAEMIRCAQCTFTTLTQKGLTIHLRKMHNVQTHNRKPRRTQNRRQGIRLANCSMSAKSWGLPFVCVICGYRTAEKIVIKDHVEVHLKEDDHKLRASPCESAFNSAIGQPGTSAGMDRHTVYTVHETFKKIMNCENIVVGFSSKPEPVVHMPHGSAQYPPNAIHYSDISEQTYMIRHSNDVDANMDEVSGGQHEDEFDDEDAEE